MSRSAHGRAAVAVVPVCAKGEARGGTVDFVAWMKAQGMSGRTVGLYGGVARRWIASHPDPEAATHVEVTAWLASLQVAPPSVVTYRKALRAWYRWLQWTDVRADNPVDRVPRPALEQGRPRPVPLDDLRRVIECARHPHVRLWLCLGALQGLRLSEIAAIRRHHITEEHVTVELGKGRRRRMVPTHPTTWRAVQRCDEWWTLAPGTIGTSIAAYLRASGVDATTHQLRHAFGTQVYRGSHGDLLLTQRLLGHASVTSTQIYAEPDDAGGAAVRTIAV